MRVLTAGESHGKGLVGLIEGLPSGARIDLERVNNELERRYFGRRQRKRHAPRTTRQSDRRPSDGRYGKERYPRCARAAF